jgi:fibronectin type 3 domain-containing protein
MRSSIPVVALLMCAAPAAMAQGVVVPKASAFEVILSWDAPPSSTDPVASYDAFRAPSGSTAYAQLNAAPITTTSYTDLTISASQTYDYIVESVDANGVTSAPSNEAVVSVPVVPTAPAVSNFKTS